MKYIWIGKTDFYLLLMCMLRESHGESEVNIIIIIIMIFNQGAHISEEFFSEALDKIHIDNTNYE